MSSNLIVIDSLQGIKDLISYLADKEYIAFDTETTGVLSTSEIIGMSFCAEDDKAFYVILHKYTLADGLVSILGKDALILDLVNSLKGKSLVMHNGVFDCSIVESYFKISLIDDLHTDTMVLAHLLNENRRIGLKELGKEYFGQDADKEAAAMKASVIANGGKLTKNCYEMYKADSQLMALYGAKDALLTYRLFGVLVGELYDQGLEDFFYIDESMPLLRTATYQLNTTGLKVDQQALTTLKKTLEAECLEARDFIYAEIRSKISAKYPGKSKKDTFNISSNQQLAWLLFGIYELEFSKLTSGGKIVAKHLGVKHYSKTEKRNFIFACHQAYGAVLQPAAIVNGKKKNATAIKEPWAYIQVDKKTLAKIAPKLKWVERLLEYTRKKKLLTTYVKGIEDKIQYGIIRPSFLQTGTTSGRYSSRSPNWQNLPRDDKRIKECIVSRPGKVFVGADYSQLEPRVFSYLSQDTNLMAAFNGSDDFYSIIGAKVYNKTDCTLKKEGSPDAFGVKYKKLRDLAKVIALASVYGATAHQLMQTTGKSIEDTQSDIDAYFEEFQGVANFMIESHKFAKKNGRVVNLFGRPRRIPDAAKIERLYGNITHSELPYEARSLLNLSTNHRVQSTAASIVNRATIKFYNDCKEVGISVSIVAQIHDELIVECNEEDAENISVLLQNAMETATILPGVPLEAIPRITRNFSK